MCSSYEEVCIPQDRSLLLDKSLVELYIFVEKEERQLSASEPVKLILETKVRYFYSSRGRAESGCHCRFMCYFCSLITDRQPLLCLNHNLMTNYTQCARTVEKSSFFKWNAQNGSKLHCKFLVLFPFLYCFSMAFSAPSPFAW